MYGNGCHHAFLLLVSDQKLTANHSMENVAVLSAQAAHPLYSPLMRFLELLENIKEVFWDINVPVPTGVKVCASTSCCRPAHWQQLHMRLPFCVEHESALAMLDAAGWLSSVSTF